MRGERPGPLTSHLSPTCQRWVSADPHHLHMDESVNQPGHQRLSIYGGRHAGWWVKGRSRKGRMWTWWPTQKLALAAARFWQRIVGWTTGHTVVIVDEP